MCRTPMKGWIQAGLTAALLAGSGSHVAWSQTRTDSVAVEVAQQFFDQRAPASAAASSLRQTHARSIDQTATILHTVGYDPTAIVGALRSEFRASLSDLYAALVTTGMDRTQVSGGFAGNRITLDCIDRQGHPRPCGNFGGGMDQPAMGQLTWTPPQNGYVDSLLTLTGSNIPPLTVRIGSTSLATVSASASQVVVRLPSQPTQGPLTVLRTSDGVEGKLMTGYKVIAAPPPWKALGTAATGGAFEDMTRWLTGAKLLAERCHVNGALVVGTAGVLATDTDFEGKVRSRLIAGGAPETAASAWGAAFHAAWRAWAEGATVPSLPWFPGFVAYPGGHAPPTPAPATPLGALVSGGVHHMLSENLRARLALALSPSMDEAGLAQAIESFSDAVAARFARLLTLGLVTNVTGGGPVPSYAPPAVPSGSVVGTCSGVNVVPNAGLIY